ncbi:radical SAM family heme chaperone HemW [Desulfosporosinus sp. BICA1-9]|uniref:radical SAM family heme chaperone HemW n=1 Tax=Desulfosporosinus sp. BICA1-9 TaxID=1531958 RepID=UPI00054BD95F|nr:radical SAM family heme chaperone HemW [Desulfosporosinus sp. BICA1-9]KJS46729.1 MAG: coproporphyrinogen III oxidase [Peptococcaceae bacterium BRH_c23]KJS88701.1 MAG: coproporphyrinogen III oxidase [Desulfosporosinus sp. BICA1-9]HBW35315.1 coproporphyrinogen III oxidase family protein [Desulfosporosinus sp.]
MPSLYVHVPFCVQKCDYCAFYSQALVDNPKELISVYLEGLEVESSARQKDAPQGVSSLFIGGGTPTALKDNELEQLLGMIHQFFSINSGAEKTVEGNPGTLSDEKLVILRRYGINRFSLGVQSFDDSLLRAVGRVHTAEQARKALRRLRMAGFKNVNLDLMFGLPGQDMAAWDASLEEALSYSPEHLSLYGLMLEEGTPLYGRYMGTREVKRGDKEELYRLPDDDLQAEMYEWAVPRLKQAGYRQYETSNFALPGFECQHNLGYWRGGDYLGLGPGGVSCLDRVRWKNIEDVCSYAKLLLKGESPLDEAGQEVLSLRECMAERMILGLRLAEGVDLSSFRNDFGADLRDIYRDVLARYDKEIFVFQGEYLCLNPKYAFVANSILQEFV